MSDKARTARSVVRETEEENQSKDEMPSTYPFLCRKLHVLTNHDAKVLKVWESDNRIFENWSMGFCALGASELETAGYEQFEKSNMSLLELAGCVDSSVDFMQTFSPLG